MDDVLEELGITTLRTNLLSDDERMLLQELCDNYTTSSTELDRNDYKRKIKKLINNLENSS